MPLLICCFSDLSQTHLKGSRGIKLKIKGKRGKNLHENTIIWEKNSIFLKLFSVSHFMNVQEDPRNNKSIESGLNTHFFIYVIYLSFVHCSVLIFISLFWRNLNQQNIRLGNIMLLVNANSGKSMSSKNLYFSVFSKTLSSICLSTIKKTKNTHNTRRLGYKKCPPVESRTLVIINLWPSSWTTDCCREKTDHNVKTIKQWASYN